TRSMSLLKIVPGVLETLTLSEPRTVSEAKSLFAATRSAVSLSAVNVLPGQASQPRMTSTAYSPKTSLSRLFRASFVCSSRMTRSLTSRQCRTSSIEPAIAHLQIELQRGTAVGFKMVGEGHATVVRGPQVASDQSSVRP